MPDSHAVRPRCGLPLLRFAARPGTMVDEFVRAWRAQAERGSTVTTGTTTLGEIIELLEEAYPPRLAESWDRVGLVAGDRAAPVRRVVVAVDATDAVVDHALAEGADLLVVHHPPLMKGVHSIATDTPKGRLLHRLVVGGCALFAAHTNADAARPGVNDALAEASRTPPVACLQWRRTGPRW